MAYENTSGTHWQEVTVLDLFTLEGSLYVETYGLHHLAKATREIGGILKFSSVMKPTGRLKTETVVEERGDNVERLATGGRSLRALHARVTRQLLPSPIQADPDSGPEPPVVPSEHRGD